MKSFDEIFDEVMDAHNINNWWELFDNDLVIEVVKAIAKEYHFYFCKDDDIFSVLMDNLKGFEEWYNEMCKELSIY